jgi:hypothetical protein
MTMRELTLDDLDGDTFDENDVPLTTRIALARQQLALWQNTAYDARLRYRVNKGFGAEAPVLEAIKREYGQALQAIEALKEEIALLISANPMSPADHRTGTSHQRRYNPFPRRPDTRRHRRRPGTHRR